MGSINTIPNLSIGNALFVATTVDAETGASPHTYTAAETLGGIINASGQTGAIVGNLDTGSNLDTLCLPLGICTGEGFNWSLINRNTSSGAITLTANTDHTIVGNPVVAIATSALLRTVRTGSHVYVTYVLG
jgi:hypothetical protein